MLFSAGAANNIVRLAFLASVVSIGSMMMIMPLGPDLVEGIGFDPAQIGNLVGGAMLGSAAASVLFAGLLDRFDRRPLLISLLGARALIFLACGFAREPAQLTGLFILAGCINGPTIAVMMATLVDVIPDRQRGRAMALVATAFSVAAILAVPLSLQLSLHFGWRSTFLAFGLAGVALTVMAMATIPSMTGHLEAKIDRGLLFKLLRQPAIGLALAVVAGQTLAHFLIVANFASHFQFNLGFPRENMALLYLIGGISTLVLLKASGHFFDHGWRHSNHMANAILAGIAITLTYLVHPPTASLYLLFALFMAGSTARTSSTNSLLVSLPRPRQRAAFMSLHNAASGVGSGLAGFLSSLLLTTAPDGQLTGMSGLAMCSLILTLAMPVITWVWLSPRLTRQPDSAST